MFSEQEYVLVDFGAGRRLERFGPLLLDRLCPVAEGIRRGAPALWSRADARFVPQKSDSPSKNRQKNASNALGFRGVWEPLTELGRQYFNAETVADASQGQRAETLSSQPWTINCAGRFLFELKGSPFGHLGVFPEQAENWDRIDELCRKIGRQNGRRPRVLNLFGYTGGSALAAAAAGAETTHLDAARNIVAQARRNAALSFPTPNADVDAEAETPFENAAESADHQDAEQNPTQLKASKPLNSTDATRPTPGSLRWIVDDAVKFVKRELKRGVVYDGVILDPPTYGHGARGEVWRLSRDLPPLLERCVELLSETTAFVMLTCHTPGFEAPTLDRLLRSTFRARFGSETGFRRLAKPLGIESQKNGTLPAGDLALLVRETK
ncbi:MAG: class I SAM-dependent methyltransferase [Thermoguttaceae bacterium]|nr:class I SAM-dependent methyltransferase [Thermoguttaceae bacterium]